VIIKKIARKGALLHFEMFRITPINPAANGAHKIIDNSRKFQALCGITSDMSIVRK
jgi:hypothetical protein